MKKIVKLTQTSWAAPEQWEGETEDGLSVYARERHEEVRVELNGEVIHRSYGGTALAALRSLFEIPQEVVVEELPDISWLIE